MPAAACSRGSVQPKLGNLAWCSAGSVDGLDNRSTVCDSCPSGGMSFLASVEGGIEGLNGNGSDSMNYYRALVSVDEAQTSSAAEMASYSSQALYTLPLWSLTKAWGPC